MFKFLSDFFNELRNSRITAAFFSLVIAQQAIFLLKYPPIYETDTLSYLEPAKQILETGTFYSEIRVPGYPAILAAAEKLAGIGQAAAVAALQHFLGILIWIAAMMMLKTKRVKVIFSVFWLMDILFNSYQHVLLPDFMLGFLLFASAAVLYDENGQNDSCRNFIYSGLLMAMALLTKPAAYLFFAFAMPIFYFTKGSLEQKIKKYAAFALFPILAININCINNYSHAGKYSFLTFSGSYSFFTFINFIEPGNSALAPFFDTKSLHRNMGNEEKLKVSSDIMEKIINSGYKPEEIDKELKKIFISSVISHPFIFAKKTFYETAHFFLNAHNQYAKHYSGNLAFNLGEAVKNGNYGAALKKFIYSMHFFYWTIFALFASYLAITSKALKKHKKNAFRIAEKHFFEIFSIWIIVYITAVTVLTCQGDARYRVPLQPFLLYFAAISADKIMQNFKSKGH